MKIKISISAVAAKWAFLGRFTHPAIVGNCKWPQKGMSRTIKSRSWWEKTPHEPQICKRNAENQPDFCPLKEKIMKNNRPEPRSHRRIPARRREVAEVSRRQSEA